jgi:hypothetical protein
MRNLIYIYNILEELATKQINKQFRPALWITGGYSKIVHAHSKQKGGIIYVLITHKCGACEHLAENLEPLHREPMNDYIFYVL